MTPPITALDRPTRIWSLLRRTELVHCEVCFVEDGVTVRIRRSGQPPWLRHFRTGEDPIDWAEEARRAFTRDGWAEVPPRSRRIAPARPAVH